VIADGGRSDGTGRLLGYPARGALVATLAGLALAGGAAAAPTGAASSRLERAPSSRAAPPPKLRATVSIVGNVTLKNSAGTVVKRLQPGWYTIVVTVDSRAANFQLAGPGVKKATPKGFVGVALWGVHLAKGTYTYTTSVPHAAKRRVVVS
jgi:hypothetical protein